MRIPANGLFFNRNSLPWRVFVSGPDNFTTLCPTQDPARAGMPLRYALLKRHKLCTDHYIDNKPANGYTPRLWSMSMAIFGKNGFIRQQEVAFAKKLLAWKYENDGIVVPDAATLQAQAENIVSDAHEIARKRGSNILEIVKKQIKDIKK